MASVGSSIRRAGAREVWMRPCALHGLGQPLLGMWGAARGTVPNLGEEGLGGVPPSCL